MQYGLVVIIPYHILAVDAMGLIGGLMVSVSLVHGVLVLVMGARGHGFPSFRSESIAVVFTGSCYIKKYRLTGRPL